MTQYEQDNDANLPVFEKTTSGPSWREAVYPYVKASGVYQCPDDRRRGDYTSNNLPRSYATNDLLPGKDGLPAPLTGLHTGGTSTITSSHTIRIVDTRGYDGAEWDITNPMFLPDTGRVLYAHGPRHLFYEHPIGVLNCLFADGHVKAMKPMATLTPVNLWTRDNAPFTGQDLRNARTILKHAENE